MIVSDRKATLDAYVLAWNTPDEAERRRLLELSWADGATYTDPSAHLEGRDALDGHLRRLAERSPGGTVALTGPIDEHHTVARFPWARFGPDGETLRAGLDFAEFAPDGRLTRIVGFFEP